MRLAATIQWVFMLVMAGCAETPVPVAEVPDRGEEIRWLRACAHKMPETLYLTVDQLRGTGQMTWIVHHKTLSVKLNDELVVSCRQPQGEHTLVDSPWLFAGYGRWIPALGIDDFGPQDLTGKTVILMAGNSRLPDDVMVDSEQALASAGQYLDLKEEDRIDHALARGAALVLVVTGPEQFTRHQRFPELVLHLPESARSIPRGGMVGWTTSQIWGQWLKKAGEHPESLVLQARRLDFQPVPLPLQTAGVLSCRAQSVEMEIPASLATSIASMQGGDTPSLILSTP
ncbi:MAG: hypothetical protein HO274_06180 [Ferrovum myxofaciens]|uniref:hypothetical protein n=1 Tax=Ferrovum myxofaciens TaxID=416213 RepID=UPI002355FBFE|nr:hypothetical protein [Ferrovum myxofaciens]QKE40937.1 MAG: hypothetical protein HO274_06180 [Ferrovum myxofaciens]